MSVNMFRFRAYIMSAAIFFASIFSAFPNEIPPKAKTLIRNLLDLAQNENIWPGYNPLKQPVALHIKNKGTYVFGIKKIPAECLPVRGFSAPVCFLRNKKDDDMRAEFFSNYYLPGIGNVFFYNYVGDLLSAEIVIVHETFHDFQHFNFLDSFNTEKTPQKNKDYSRGYIHDLKLVWNWVAALLSRKRDSFEIRANDIVLAYIENKLLAQALLDKRNYKTLTSEFVIVREYRRSKLPLRLLNREIEGERIEGMAEYLGWKSVATHFLPLLAENNKAGMLLSPMPLMNPHRRFYSTGAAQAFLLDRLKIPWKKRVQRGEDIFSLMKEFFPPTKNTRKLKRLLKELDSDWLKGAVVLHKRKSETEKMRTIKRLKEYNGWLLVFRKNSRCASYASDCYYDPIKLSDGSFYKEKCYTELKCEKVSLIVDRPLVTDGENITVFLGPEPNFDLLVDNVRLSTAPTSIFFRRLDFETEGLQLKLSIYGKLNINRETVSVEIIGNENH